MRRRAIMILTISNQPDKTWTVFDGVAKSHDGLARSRGKHGLPWPSRPPCASAHGARRDAQIVLANVTVRSASGDAGICRSSRAYAGDADVAGRSLAFAISMSADMRRAAIPSAVAPPVFLRWSG